MDLSLEKDVCSRCMLIVSKENYGFKTVIFNRSAKAHWCVRDGL